MGKQLPDQVLPSSIRTAFQEMWASNGDAISRQYAGTAAMKVRCIVHRRISLFTFRSGCRLDGLHFRVNCRLGGDGDGQPMADAQIVRVPYLLLRLIYLYQSA